MNICLAKGECSVAWIMVVVVKVAVVAAVAVCLDAGHGERSDSRVGFEG